MEGKVMLGEQQIKVKLSLPARHKDEISKQSDSTKCKFRQPTSKPPTNIQKSSRICHNLSSWRCLKPVAVLENRQARPVLPPDKRGGTPCLLSQMYSDC